MVGDDPELLAAVAAELRAAGVTVTVLSGTPGPGPAGGAPVVRLERRGESVVVHTAVTIGAAEHSQLKASQAGDGLAAEAELVAVPVEAVVDLVLGLTEEVEVVVDAEAAEIETFFS